MDWRRYLSDNGPLLLDGGLATELEAQGFSLQVYFTTNTFVAMWLD